MPEPQTLPTTLLTGFLGSGKTTLLRRALASPALADTAVIINEIGEIAIDHYLVDFVEGGVVELPGGCLCCADPRGSGAHPTQSARPARGRRDPAVPPDRHRNHRSRRSGADPLHLGRRPDARPLPASGRGRHLGRCGTWRRHHRPLRRGSASGGARRYSSHQQDGSRAARLRSDAPARSDQRPRAAHFGSRGQRSWRGIVRRPRSHRAGASIERAGCRPYPRHRQLCHQSRRPDHPSRLRPRPRRARPRTGQRFVAGQGDRAFRPTARSDRR